MLLTTLLVALSLRGACGEGDSTGNSTPGVRLVAPGVLDFGEQSSDSDVSYYGFWDVKANRSAVYSAPERSVTLTDLVENASRLSDETTRMAYVIRNGRCGVRIPWTKESSDRLLAGDLVVFQTREDGVRGDGSRGAESVGTGLDTNPGESANTDVVQIALVGLLERRPVVLALEKQYADILHVVEELHQPPEVARTVRVICTDGRLGALVPREPPARLEDGDVLIFDRQYLNLAGLAQAPKFPDTIPMRMEAVPEEYGNLELRNAEAVAVPPDQFAAESHAGAAVEDSPDALSMSTADLYSETVALPFLDLGAVNPDETADETKLGRSDSTLVGSDDPFVDESQPETRTALFEPSREPSRISQTSNLVPAPIEPAHTSLAVGSRGPLASVNTYTIAFGVLVLAGLCFLVSVAWSRIDRTAQSLQQPLPAGSVDADYARSRRRLMDRLIGNNLPMVEELTQLPDRMDYHGEERGRRRLVIDSPHALAGPHFAVRTEEAASSQQRTPTASSQQRTPVASSQQRTPAASPEGAADTLVGNAEIESRLDRVVEQELRSGSRQPQEDGTDIRDHGKHTSEEGSSALQPHNSPSPSTGRPQQQSGLLERVLIAMERERRR